MECVTMGFINIPKRFLKNHKTSNAFNLCSTSLHDSLLQLCQHVNEKHESVAESVIEELSKKMEIIPGRKGPPEELAKVLNEHTLHRGYVFQMAVQEEAFRSNQLHDKTLKLEQYRSLVLQPFSRGTAPISLV